MATLITQQPVGGIINLSGLLNLLVGTLTEPNLKFQWRLNGRNIPGATNSTYSKAGILSSDAGLYTVVVAGQSGTETSDGALISLTGLLQLSASDSFAGRAPLLNLLNLMSYDNTSDTTEPGEPLIGGIPGGKSVWFTWTPLLGGVATITTAGSSFDTLLGVYWHRAQQPHGSGE